MSGDIKFHLPEPHFAWKVFLEDDTWISVRQLGNPKGPRLVLGHGNSLAMDLYYPFWSLLLEDFEVILFDIRNHGWNPRGDIKNHHIANFVRDLDKVMESLRDQLGPKPTIGVFHSISTLIGLLYSSNFDAFSPSKEPSQLFSALMLFDPPICTSALDLAKLKKASKKSSKMARKRGNFFKKKEEFTEILACTPSFKGVVPGALELITEAVLRKNEKKSCYELRCSSDYEAQIADYYRSYSLLVNFTDVSCPVKILGSDPTVSYSYLPTIDFSHIVNMDYSLLPGSTHWLQIEKPKECVEQLYQFLNANGLLSIASTNSS